MSNQNKSPQGQPPQGMPMGRPGPGFGPGGRRGPGGPMGARLNKEKPKNTGKTLLRLVKVIGRSKYFLIALLLTMSAVTVLELFGPSLQGQAIDTIQLVDGKFTVDFDNLKQILLKMIVLFAFSTNTEHMPL